MNLRNHTAELNIPYPLPEPDALQRITHHGIRAHQEYMEFINFHVIVESIAPQHK